MKNGVIVLHLLQLEDIYTRLYIHIYDKIFSYYKCNCATKYN